MRKIIIIFLIIVFGLFITACDNGTTGNGNGGNNGGNQGGNGGNGNGGGNGGTPSTNFTPITGWNMMEKLGIGINIANTLDARPFGCNPASYDNQCPEKPCITPCPPSVWNWLGNNHMNSETCWGNPKIEKRHFQEIASKGFDSVRIPVSWEIHLDNNGTIRKEWMDRVQQAVDWALSEGLYVVINTHHERSTPQSLYDLIDTGDMTGAKAWLTNIWSQIAERFKNYPETLLFEPMNEPYRITQGGWIWDWSSGSQVLDTPLASRVNELNSFALNLIRNSGGYNDKRVVINAVPGAQSDMLVHYTHTSNDPYTMLGIFYYPPHPFEPIPEALNKNIPIYIKETGTLPEFGMTNIPQMVSWVQDYFKRFADLGIPTAWWNHTHDIGFLFNTRTGEWESSLVDAVFAAYENTTPPNGGGTTPNAVSGNLGNYIFGTQADGVSVNIQHAVWNLSGVNLTNIKNADAQLVLGLSKAPNSSLQLVWQGPANNLWWNQNDILGGTGNVLNASHVTWNSGTNTLTINLAAALDNYSAFTAQPSLNLIIAYYGGSSVNDLGIVSANIVVSSGNGGQDGTPGTPSTPQPFNNITASQLVSNIRVGWNLGNSLDSANLFHKGSNLTVEQLEIGWDDLPIATKALIDAVKTAGFNAIRIPVTWSKAADSNYNIRADWMARITEVVNYAVDNDMYIILNTHHDDMDTSINNEVLFQFINAGINKSLIAFRKIWEQIADNFKNYNEKLIFEALNEPRTIDSPNEWTGGTAEERNNLNKHYELFIDVVRKSGGNNDKRILMINTYAASSSQIALDGLVLPTDTIANKLIVSVHDYAPYNFALNSWNIGEQGSVDTWNPDNTADKLAITEPIDRLYEKFVSKGIPVIMGEFGSVNKNNLAARVVHAEFYISYAKSKGIRCFWWDNGLTVPRLGVEDGNFGIINRNNNQWTHPEIASALMRGADSAAPPNGGDITPNLIGGNLGNYIFGNNEGNIVYTQAVWNNLSNENLTLIKNPTVQLVLVLSQAPTSSLQLVWQGPANQLWWNQNDILGGIGNIVNAAYAIWNSGTNTLTINLAAALAEYSAFTTQPSLNLIIAYYGGSSVNDLGIVSANIVVP